MPMSISTVLALVDSKHGKATLKAAELVAEDLRYAQDSLGQITGDFSSDDLLGAIFSSFCIGK